MAVADGTQARFEIGRVASRAFGAIGHNALTFALLSLVPGIPAAFIAWRIAGLDMRTAVSVDPAEATVIGMAVVAYFVAAFVFQASVVHGTIAYLNGRRASAISCLATALRHLFPLLAIGLLIGLGLLAGFLLLLIPGFILAATWAVAVPARVAERVSATDALKRSRELTYGHRWAVFGLLALFFALAFAIRIGARIVLVVTILFAAPAGATAAQTEPTLIAASSALSAIASMVSITVGAAGIASLYYELRRVKEGIGPESLASVFD
jgi:hypothetical protein